MDRWRRFPSGLRNVLLLLILSLLGDLFLLQGIPGPFFVHAVPTLASPCPTDECVCVYANEIDCQFQSLNQVPYFYKDNETYIFVDLSKNRIKRIPTDAFQNLKVREIYVYRNKRPLDFHPKAFRGLENVLRNVEVKRNRFVPRIPRGLFRNLKELKEIDFSENGLMLLEKGAFHGAEHVLQLDLSNNDLIHLDPNVFVGLKRLQVMSLNGNAITIIDSRAFNGLESLEELTLEDNRIRDLQPRVFKKLRSLKKLYMSDNEIPALFPLMFRGLPQLEILSLSNNKILMIGEGTFSTMQSLSQLSLAKCKLSYLEPRAFLGLSKLRELDLQHNNLRELPDGLFQHAKKLKRVVLDSNRLVTLNACAFEGLDSMELIAVRWNAMHCDCSLKWTTEDGAPEVIGDCQSPAILKGMDIALPEEYMVCIEEGVYCVKHKT